MDKPCGCSTAEQCFASCCCNSPADLLAWAQARGLEPATVAALERRVIAADADATSSSCCAAASCAAAPAAGGASDAIDFCNEYQSLAARPAPESPADEQESAEDAAPPSAGSRMVSFTAMLACQGVLEGFMAATTALPPPSPCVSAPAMPLVGMIATDDDTRPCVVIPRDTPPPRS